MVSQYFFYIILLGKTIVRAINDGFETGEMPSTQKEGIIICIPKGDKPREYLKNWTLTPEEANDLQGTNSVEEATYEK